MARLLQNLRDGSIDMPSAERIAQIRHDNQLKMNSQSKFRNLAVVFLGFLATTLSAQTYTFRTIAGGTQGSNNGVNMAGQFYYPTGIAVDGSGNVYVADAGNNAIRRIFPKGTNWIVTTIAGGTSGSRDGTGTNAQFYFPTGLALDSATNIYVADQHNATIRKITPSGTNWIVSTIAGQAGRTGTNNGANTNALFYSPTGVAVDASGNVFVADEVNNAIREIMPAGGNWVVSTIAGGTSGHADGTNGQAQFSYPSGVAVDSSDRVFVADQINNTIRLITPMGTNWVVKTIAGNLIAGASNGVGTNALFFQPVGLSLNTNGSLYIADLFNHAIREVTPSGSNWVVTTVAGGQHGTNNGVGTNAQFFEPNGVSFDVEGDMFVADSGNNAIREGTSSLAPPPLGNLTVYLTPTAAVTNGAAWQLNGGAYQSNGTTISNLAAGKYLLSFSNVPGYTTPADQNVSVTAYQTTVATANYPVAIPNAGSLQVQLYPWGAAHSGGAWQVNGGALQTNGAIVAGLPLGSNLLSFAPVAGYLTPPPQVVTITNSETTLGIGIYTLVNGSVFTVTANAIPPTEGTVAVSSTNFVAGGQAVVTATPGSGYEFIGWAGQATGTNNPLTIIVNTNLTVNGYFAPVGSATLIVITNGLGSVVPNLNNRPLVKNRTYSLTAIAKLNNVFSNWTGTITTNRDPLAIKLINSMVIQANFIPNPFLPVRGIYNGLFMTTNGVTETTAGMLSHLVITPTGTYSGTILIAGTRRGISGRFNLAGEATNVIVRPASQGGPLVVNMSLGLDAAPYQITGTISNASWVANLVADQGTNVLHSAEFTMLIPPDLVNNPPTGSPGGDGFLAITNYATTPRSAAAAIARVTGALADGTRFVQAVPISADGYLPLFSSLYGGKGLVLAWLNLTLTNESGVGLTWIHPQVRTGLYQSGFTNIYGAFQLPISGWSNNPAILNLFTNLALVDVVTNTNALATYPIVIGTGGRIAVSNVRGTLNPRTGVFQATVGTGADAVVANGAVLLNQTNGGGYYLTKTNAQGVLLDNP
jgi:sugar lactone lactonase YvrE